MIEFGFEVATAVPWFVSDHDAPYVLIEVTPERAAEWGAALCHFVRRSYIADSHLQSRSQATGFAKPDIVAALMPDPGSIMSGEFGELLTTLFQAALAHPQAAICPKKNRFKVARSKPAPFSDVIHFVVPSWPNASADDRLLCSEVKTKATAAASSAVAQAIQDSIKDQLSRLAKTLVWLRERAMSEDLGTTTIPLLNRFIDAVEHPPARREFRAVVVVCSSLLAQEIAQSVAELSGSYPVVLISVPNLKAKYEEVFAVALTSAALVTGQ